MTGFTCSVRTLKPCCCRGMKRGAVEPARSAAPLLICHSRSCSAVDLCSAVPWYVLAQSVGQTKQFSALLTEGYLTCPAAYRGASRKKKQGIEIEPGKWDLVWAACDLRGTLAGPEVCLCKSCCRRAACRELLLRSPTKAVG